MKQQMIRERNRLLHTLDRLLDGPMIFLGFVWLVLLVIELVRGLSPVLELLSITIWVVFLIDMLIKFFLSPKKIHFLKKNWLTVISLVIPAFRIFRLLRILRLLRGIRLI